MKKIFTTLFPLVVITVYAQQDALYNGKIVQEFETTVSKQACSFDTPAVTTHSYQGRPDLAIFANDFSVPAHTQVTLQTVDIPLMVYNSTESVSSITAYLYEDNAGVPGTLITTLPNVPVTSELTATVTFGGGVPGYVFNVHFDISGFSQIAASDAAKTYWIGYSASTPMAAAIYNRISPAPVGNYVKYYNTSADTWTGLTNSSGASVETAIKINADCVVLGVSETQSTVAVYPNPVTDILHFNKNILNVEVFDQSGKKFNLKAENGKLNVSHLPKGNYLLKYTDEFQKVHSQKLIKK